MKQAKHTATPWRYWETESAGEYTYAIGHNGILGYLGETGNQGEAQANAEFIVRACNAHYGLVEACESAVTLLYAIANRLGGLTSLQDKTDTQKTRAKLEQALAKAEKGE